jgi:hypothetical protein
MIHLGEGLSLPLSAATQTFLVVGKRGSGKSTTCVRLAEQLIRASVPVVALDPVDKWWGLKASRDGRGPGLSVYVFGGEHADLPLEPGAGAVIADTVVEHRISAVLSIKHFSNRQRAQFVSDFAEHLYKRNREPVHVFLEEAHEVAPQQPYAGEEEMLGRVTRLWKLGRSTGIGGSAITQRPASLSKNITTQAEILVVHRTLGPQDVAAVREWIRYHGDREDILGQLSTLKTGEAFVWAPDFPEDKPVGLRRVQVLDRETFDSTATPKVGERVVQPRALAPVDLDRLRARMAETIERAKAEDPRELRRKLSEVTAEFAKLKAHPPEAQPKVEIQQVPIVQDVQLRELEVLMSEAKAAGNAWDTRASELRTTVAAIRAACERVPGPPPPRTVVLNEEHELPRQVLTKPDGSPAKRVLNALAELVMLGVKRAPRVIVMFLAGYSHPNSTGFTKAMGALRTAGCIDYPSAEEVALTAKGLAEATVRPTRPYSSAEVQERIFRLLGGPAARVLAPLVKAYPSPLPRDAVMRAAGYTHGNSTGFTKAMGQLRSLGLIDYPDRGSAVATPLLFLGRS